MIKQYRIEQKFFCKNQDDLLYQILKLEPKLEEVTYEIEEYFTDIKCEMIKNKNQLKLCRKNRENLEISYFGMSFIIPQLDVKNECHFVQDIKNYENLVKLFSVLGYYRYIYVEKTRKKYSKKQGNKMYDILVDEIKNIGSLVEFSITSEDGEIDIEDLRTSLKEFMAKFHGMGLEEMMLTDRDFIAREIYRKNITRNFKEILIDMTEVFPKIDDTNLKDVIKTDTVALNLYLIEKLEELGIQVTILTKGLSEEVVGRICSEINTQEHRFHVKRQEELEEILLDQTIIVKNESNHFFSSLAFIILNWYEREGEK